MKFPKRDAGGSGGSEKYLQFKDGESKNVILRGELYEFAVKWVNGKSQVVQQTDPEAKTRFKINAVVYEAGKFHAKVWEISQTVCNQLADIHTEYPLDQTKIKITRQGTGTETVYHILPLVSEKDKLSQALLHQIAAVELNILDTPKSKAPASNGWDASQAGPEDYGPPPVDFSNFENIPF